MGLLINDMIFYAVLAQMFGNMIIGFVFDIFDRRWTIFSSVLVTVLFLIAIPYAPNIYPWMILFRIGLSMSLVAPMCNPLINDYVKKESRGKAIAF